MRKILLLLLCMCISFNIFAQSDTFTDRDPFNFNFGVGLGSLILENPQTGVQETWSNIRLQPEFAIDDFAIGLDLEINFTFSEEDGSPGFRIREADWIPPGEVTFQGVLELYLPLIRYLRYGNKGDDFYAALGSLDNFYLGNGFIVSNYSNRQFEPERRITGLSLDLDGKLFNFPYFGIETAIGNLSAIDIFAARIFARPLYWLDVPAIKELQLGFTLALDRVPFHYERQAGNSTFSDLFSREEPIIIFGADIRLPILNEELVELAIYGDIASQNENIGGMAGLRGKFFGFLELRNEYLFLGPNFIPNYFDKNYDLYRAERWQIYSGEISTSEYFGWLVELGFDFFEGSLAFNAKLEGPFEFNTTVDYFNPTLTAIFHLSPDLLGGFSFDFEYEKRYIREIVDLISADDATMLIRIGYDFGGVRIGLNYELQYDSSPGPNQVDTNGSPRYWTTNTSFETSFTLVEL